uniref:Golgi-associated plant pathogenesis-related protein 1-like n=1 Tax=Diabrotica virgifera virgifera TaxID=50390 RepID=A0A6P7GVH5_DIAVI
MYYIGKTVYFILKCFILGSIYVVANYSPAGNFVGHYVENVPPVKPTWFADSSSKKDPSPRSSSKSLASPSSPGLCSQGNFSDFALEALKVHNEYRRRHGTQDLVLSEEICRYAQEWADTCARTASLQHRANSQYGENIFSVYSSDYSHTPSARDAVKEWYDEVKRHTFGVERVNQGSLHFTQVIWKESKELGIGMAKNKRGQTYVVANYSPRGNYIGQFVENVPRPRS